MFIHPFEDGNGRIHRYLIHHVLAKKQFAQQGMIFPVSASILEHIDEYRRVLESMSRPLMDFIDWKETPDHNVDVNLRPGRFNMQAISRVDYQEE